MCTGVSLSTGGGAWSRGVHGPGGGAWSWGVHGLGGAWSRGCMVEGVHSPGGCLVETPLTATAAGGTHPYWNAFLF